MANPERSNLDRLKTIYGSQTGDLWAEPTTPLEIQRRVLASQDRLEELPFSYLVDQYPPFQEDVLAKGDGPENKENLNQEKEKSFLLGIKTIFEEISSWPDFPYQQCDRASRFLAKKMKNISVVMGWFHLDRPIGLYLPSWDKPIEPHTWNVDQRGRIIDLTVFQFNQGLDDPFPKQPLIIEKDIFVANRYQKSGGQI
ncbi:MAG: hypothetical protein ACOYJ8_00215 [Patescibacteria group bacterium]|jgi:hypothetical protein